LHILEGVLQCFMLQSCLLRQGHKPKVIKLKPCKKTKEKDAEESNRQEERWQGFQISSLRCYMMGDEYLCSALCSKPLLLHLDISYPNPA
jgi:hypothetical protein